MVLEASDDTKTKAAFVGAKFTEAIVARVRITLGTGVLGAATNDISAGLSISLSQTISSTESRGTFSKTHLAFQVVMQDDGRIVLTVRRFASSPASRTRLRSNGVRQLVPPPGGFKHHADHGQRQERDFRPQQEHTLRRRTVNHDAEHARRRGDADDRGHEVESPE